MVLQLLGEEKISRRVATEEGRERKMLLLSKVIGCAQASPPSSPLLICLTLQYNVIGSSADL